MAKKIRFDDVIYRDDFPWGILHCSPVVDKDLFLELHGLDFKVLFSPVQNEITGERVEGYRVIYASTGEVFGMINFNNLIVIQNADLTDILLPYLKVGDLVLESAGKMGRRVYFLVKDGTGFSDHEEKAYLLAHDHLTNTLFTYTPVILNSRSRIVMALGCTKKFIDVDKMLAGRYEDFEPMKQALDPNRVEDSHWIAEQGILDSDLHGTYYHTYLAVCREATLCFFNVPSSAKAEDQLYHIFFGTGFKKMKKTLDTICKQVY